MKLRFPMPKDAERMLSWMHNPETAKIFATDFASFTAEKVANFIENANSDPACVNFVCVDDDDRYLGTVSLKNIDTGAKTAEYAVSFCYDAQGTGASRFATIAILKHAFEDLSLERVYLNVIPQNVRANRFYQKMGFVFEGEFRNHIVINGAPSNLCWYGMLKEEYIALYGKSAE